MKAIEKIHKIITTISKDSQVNITKIDDMTFNVDIGGDSIMAAFVKLGEVQKRIDESCCDK